MQKVQQAPMSHQLSHNINRFILRADSIELDQLPMT